MLTVNKLIPQSRGLAAVLLKRAATVELDWDVRQKSRFDAQDSSGRQLGVFLPRGTVVRGSDTLVAEDGSLIVVRAAPQPVLVVRHCSTHGKPFDLMRAAYHLGNRHVALALQPDRLLLEPDHVLAEMLRSMHLIVSEENVAFEPESGAYAASEGHAHHQHGAHAGHGHDHDHDHGHDHGPAHDHPAASTPASPSRGGGKPLAIPVKGAATPHVHGPGCGHDHGHGHGH
jgi:urease accessory protein